MSDYSRQKDFSAKDALTTGDPNKLIKGSDVDSEFDALVTAVNSKVDEPSSPSTADVLEWNGSAVAWAARNFASRIGALAPADNLYVRNGSTATTQVRVTADQLMVFTDANSGLILATIDETVTITNSGANGLDTGAEGSSTWYYVWIIYNGTSVDSLISESATAPTMPGGYTHKALVGAVYNDSSSDFIVFTQRGSLVYTEQFDLVGSTNLTSITAFSLATAVPPNASSSMLNLEVLTTTSGLALATLRPDNNTTFAGATVANPGANTAAVHVPVEVPMVVYPNQYYNVNASTDRLVIKGVGWRF